MSGGPKSIEGLRGRVRRWRIPFAFALLVRLAYWAVITPDWHPDADADQYLRIARTVADGQGFSLVFPQLEMHATAFRPPLYPMLLAPGAWLFGDAIWPARLLSVLLGSLVAVLAGVLAARIAGRTAGLAATALVACSPSLLANDTVTLTEPLALALLLGAILLLDSEEWLWAGLALGALLLTRPNGYLVVAVFAVWAWKRLGTKQALGLAACSLLVLAPWLVRNKIQVGTWKPTTSDGLTIAGVYGPIAQDQGMFIDPVFSELYGDPEHRFAQFDEAKWNEKLAKEGIDGLKDNPGYVKHIVTRNFLGYFDLRPSYNHYPEDSDGRVWWFRQWTLPIYFAVTLVGLYGFTKHWRDERTLVLLALVAQFVLVSMFLVAPPRLRAPFDLAMCIGAGFAIAGWLDARAARRGSISPIATSAG